MTKAKRHRYTSLVHLLCGIAVLCAVLLFVLPGRAGSLAGLLMYVLPPVAFVLDVMHTEPEEN